MPLLGRAEAVGISENEMVEANAAACGVETEAAVCGAERKAAARGTEREAAACNCEAEREAAAYGAEREVAARGAQLDAAAHGTEREAAACDVEREASVCEAERESSKGAPAGRVGRTDWRPPVGRLSGAPADVNHLATSSGSRHWTNKSVHCPRHSCHAVLSRNTLSM